VVRWSGRGLELVYVSKAGAARVAGPSGEIWILEGTNLFRLQDGKKGPLSRPGILAGNIREILPESSGAFWLAGSQGIAHYAPALWQEAPAQPDLRQPVHSSWKIARDTCGSPPRTTWWSSMAPPGTGTAFPACCRPSRSTSAPYGWRTMAAFS